MADTKKLTDDTSFNVGQAEAFVYRYKKQIIIAVVAILVIVGGYFAIHNLYSVPRNDKANTVLAKGQEYFAQGDFDKALNGDNTGYIGFIKIIKEYGSTDAGNLAQLYAGLSYAQMGKAKEAIKYLEDYNTAGDEMIEPAAIGALGNCYAKVGELDKAVNTLKKAAETADNNTLSPIYLIQAGEIVESQGKYDEAVKLYSQVKDKYYLSSQSQYIDKYIERAKTKAEK